LILPLFLLFLLLAFDRDMAIVYLLIMLADFIWVLTDSNLVFKLTKVGSGWGEYIESFVGLGIFLFISTLLVSIFSPQSILSGGILGGSQSIFHVLATSNPILQGSKVLTFIGWGILIPIIETSFFNGRLLEGLATYAEPVVGHKIDVTKFSMPLFVVMLIVASLFTLFHITAKGLSSVALLVTFIFSVISSIMVMRQRELKGAIVMHVVVNSLAVISMWGLF
jgi:membrane protease YdiL (CAAX protease family)